MKNRVLRSALAVILVIAMVLTMAACNNTDPVETTAPVVTSAPATTTAPTEAPVVTVTPTEAPAETVVDSDEAQLNTYGITFPEFDLTYITDGDDDQDKNSMAFGLEVDLDNIYQEAYVFEISAKISAVALDGSSLSSSKYSPDKLDWTDWYTDNDGYYDSGDISPWISGTSTETEKYYFEVAAAGVYTVTYTIEVEHDKDNEYGYYAPGEVDEKYTITKTYTVEKGELELKTSDDAFKVESSMFFVDATYSNDEIFDDVADGDYTVSIDVTSCDGTEVGEYTLSITIKDDDDNVVSASDIEFANYYVTVTEGTRYILSAEDVAKANAVRKMYYDDKSIGVTTEYSQETITYYNALTDGQKVLAAVSATKDDEYTSNWTKYYSDYLVENSAVSSSAITEAEYNMERDYLIDEVEAAIEAYMTASTTARKDAALETLSDLLLSIDNTAHKYGSDLSYVLGNLVTSVYIPSSEWQEVTYNGDTFVSVTYYEYYAVNYNEETTYFDWTDLAEGDIVNLADYSEGVFVAGWYTTADTYLDSGDAMDGDDWYEDPADLVNGKIDSCPGIFYADEYDYENTDAIFVVETTDYDTNETILSFQNVEDDETYNVTFGYGLGEGAVNAEFDEYLSDWVEDFVASLNSYNEVIADQAIAQSDIDDLTDNIAKMEGKYADLLEYQLSYKFGDTKVSEWHEEMLADAEKIVSRWDAYIALIEAYGFETTYIDNADAAEDKAATYQAMQQLLGYSLSNNDLASTVEGYTGVIDFTGFDQGFDIIFNSELESINSSEFDSSEEIGGNVEFDGIFIILDCDKTVADIEDDAYFMALENDYESDPDDEIELAYYFYDSSKNAKFYMTTAVYEALSDTYGIIEENDTAGYVETALSNVLFVANGEYTTPDLFVDGVLEACEEMMQYYIAVQAEVDAIGQDLINYLVSTGKYSSLEDLVTGYDTDDYYTSKTIYSSLSETACLEDINDWLDAYVLCELLDADSSFHSDLTKKGFDTALTNMLEDVTEDAEKQIDKLVDNLDVELVKEIDATYIVISETIADIYKTKLVGLSVDNADVVLKNNSTPVTVYTDVAGDSNVTVTVEGGEIVFGGTGTTVADGYTFEVEAVVTYTGLYVSLGSTTVTVNVTIDVNTNYFG